MSYYLTISGHKEELTGDGLKAFETAAVDKARAFVASLEGVQRAEMNTSTLGAVDLLAAPTETAPVETQSAGLEPITGGEAI